ncbi:MAG: hypothetical protein IJ356_04620 [Erysipelotrichaceae bacterium]|nr:hypothetical protein [Erysipelotrichaceae bacterium]
MSRIDYDEIKSKFADFVRTWKTKDTSSVHQFAFDGVSCRFSCCPHSNNEWDKIEGLKTFISTYPKTDVLQIAIYSYACRINGDEAQQMCHVICEAENDRDDSNLMDVFYHENCVASHWKKMDGTWKMDEIHLDVYPFYWTVDSIYDYFKQTWYLGSKLAIPQEDGRLPAIEGEYDLPWIRIPEAEDVLTEIEKIKDTAAQLYLSADYLVNDYRLITRSNYLNTNSTRYSFEEGKRTNVGSLRYKRQKDRYWAHPYKFESIQFNDDHTWARVKIYRVFGWKQRNHEYVWTRENVNIEHMCMAGYQDFVFEDQRWKVARNSMKLGIYETGPYQESLYGDII